MKATPEAFISLHSLLSQNSAKNVKSGVSSLSSGSKRKGEKKKKSLSGDYANVTAIIKTQHISWSTSKITMSTKPRLGFAL